jgi:hypothetical protein
MSRMKGRWPSPAMIIALLALFVAMGGSVYAASKLSGKTIKKNSEPGNRIKTDSLTGKQIKESTLGPVPSATNAANAANAQPVAFAHVSAGAVLDTANSKNVGSVTPVGGAGYCLSGIPFTPRGGLATVDFSDAVFQYAQFALGDEGGSCPAGTQVFVFTARDDASGAPSKAGFFVVIYG